jgi:hypothetical protein
VDEIVTRVAGEHRRRREEDYRDWELLLREYVGVREDGTWAPKCLRRVLLAFLNTGEDVVDEGCGACSTCRPRGDFLPLGERARRIIAIPPELWSAMKEVGRALDELPRIEALRHICAFLKRQEGVRWRHSVYLNTERMLREDARGVGATALVICLLSHGWVEPDDRRLEQLFELLGQRLPAAGGGLAALASLAAEAQPGSVTLAYWRAKWTAAEDAGAGRGCWRDLLALEGVPRQRVHEAARALAAGGGLGDALLAARTSRSAEDACSAYRAIPPLDLASTAVILDEAVAVFAAAGSDSERAETFAGLLLAAAQRGAAGADLVEVLDLFWPQAQAALSDETLALLVRAFTPACVGDGRWPGRFLSLPGRGRPGPLQGAVLAFGARCLAQGGRLTAPEQDALAAAAVALLGSAECPRRFPVEALGPLWDWAVARKRPDLVRRLLTADLPPEGKLVLQSFVERLVGQALDERRARSP